MMKGGYDLLTFINLLCVMNCYNFVYLYCIDENNVEAFRYTVLIHISRMTSATSARASRIKSSGAIRICKPRCPALT